MDKPQLVPLPKHLKKGKVFVDFDGETWELDPEAVDIDGTVYIRDKRSRHCLLFPIEMARRTK